MSETSPSEIVGGGAGSVPDPTAPEPGIPSPPEPTIPSDPEPGIPSSPEPASGSDELVDDDTVAANDELQQGGTQR